MSLSQIKFLLQSSLSNTLIVSWWTTYTHTNHNNTEMQHNNDIKLNTHCARARACVREWSLISQWKNTKKGAFIIHKTFTHGNRGRGRWDRSAIVTSLFPQYCHSLCNYTIFGSIGPTSFDIINFYHSYVCVQ